LFTWLEFTKARSHSSLIGDEVGIAGIGFGLPAVGVADSIHAEARDVEDLLITFPQEERQ
jgi:hypothetical protein